MTRGRRITWPATIGALALSGCVRGAHLPRLPLADAVREFVPGVVSTGHEFAATFRPDGRTVLFTRSDPATRRAHIYTAAFRAGAWRPATPLAFSRAAWSDLDPSLSPDGRRLYFASTRPRPSVARGTRSVPDMDLWYADAVGRSWSEPTWITALSSDGKEGSPTIDRGGTICFFSDRDGPPGANAIFCAPPTSGGFAPPTRLAAPVNEGPSDTSPFLAPDGRTLLFYSTRPGGAGQADLCASVEVVGKAGSGRAGTPHGAAVGREWLMGGSAAASAACTALGSSAAPPPG